MGLDYSSSVNNFSQNKLCQSTGPLDGCANGEVRAEGDLNEMLDQFLHSFEQHIDNCAAREEEEMTSEGTTEATQLYSTLNKYSRTKIQITEPHTPHPQRVHKARPAQADHPIRHPDKTPHISSRVVSSPSHTKKKPKRVRNKQPRKRKAKISAEKKSVKKSAPLCNTRIKIMYDQVDIQLLQMPVVKLERSGPLPVRVTLQEPNCLDVKVINVSV